MRALIAWRRSSIPWWRKTSKMRKITSVVHVWYLKVKRWSLSTKLSFVPLTFCSQLNANGLRRFPTMLWSPGNTIVFLVHAHIYMPVPLGNKCYFHVSWCLTVLFLIRYWRMMYRAALCRCTDRRETPCQQRGVNGIHMRACVWRFGSKYFTYFPNIAEYM